MDHQQTPPAPSPFENLRLDFIPSRLDCTPPGSLEEVNVTPDGRRLSRRIGSGGQANVYAVSGRRRDSAVKVVTGRTYERYRQLKGRWKALRHPFSVTVRRVQWQASLRRAFVTEELCEKDLLKHINETRGLTEPQAARYARQILLALAHFHSQGVAHGDVKPENILLDAERDVVKLCDFGSTILSSRSFDTDEDGSSSVMSESSTASCYSTSPLPSVSGFYSAPEMRDSFASEEGSCCYLEDPFPCDIWSMGMTIAAMVMGSDPECALRLLREERCGSPWMSDDLNDLLRRMLAPSPEQRPTTEECLDHPWLVGVDATALSLGVTSSSSASEGGQQHNWVTDSSPQGETAPFYCSGLGKRFRDH